MKESSFLSNHLFFVEGTDGDIDGDGIADDKDTCTFAQPNDIGLDMDGIADNCDLVVEKLNDGGDGQTAQPVAGGQVQSGVSLVSVELRASSRAAGELMTKTTADNGLTANIDDWRGIGGFIEPNSSTRLDLITKDYANTSTEQKDGGDKRNWYLVGASFGILGVTSCGVVLRYRQRR